MRIRRMKLDIPMNGKTAKQRCRVCKGDISNFFAQRQDFICEKCWYELNKENS